MYREEHLSSLWEIKKADFKKTFFYLVFFLFSITILTSCSDAATQVVEEGNGIYTLRKKDLSLTVSAASGGKIISLRRGEREILLQEEVNPRYYGAVLWPSPQRYFWPPSPALDSESYNVEIYDGKIRLTSRKDSLTGFRFIKEFSVTGKNEAIEINYTIENITDTARRVAAWDVTRVQGGITFFPLKDMDLDKLSSNLDHTHVENGILWYKYAQDSIKRGQKLFATTNGGWLAHQYDDILLIKTFPMVEPGELPLLQGEVEIFLAPNSAYVELENHGKYTLLEKGESLIYRQKWFLVDLGKNTANDEKQLLNTVEGHIYN